VNDLLWTGAQQQDFYDQIPVMIRELVYRLNDDDPAVLKAANAAFTALSNLVSAEELVKHVEFMRNLLASMVSEARRRKGGVGDGEFLLPGFNIPKGKQCMASRRDYIPQNEDIIPNVLPTTKQWGYTPISLTDCAALWYTVHRLFTLASLYLLYTLYYFRFGPTFAHLPARHPLW
jgi:hypothetical protein